MDDVRGHAGFNSLDKNGRIDLVGAARLARSGGRFSPATDQTLDDVDLAGNFFNSELALVSSGAPRRAPGRLFVAEPAFDDSEPE